ncbi:MAG: hypothetical protein IPN18_11110 [Ignavibacteriales bacterium]|nr:hypothetical protein [Ignavibacteriales bacterium]
MKLFKFLLVPVILLILSGSIVAQPQKEVVAKIGNREITTEEFILRYEMSPKFTAHVKGAVKALKEELIYTVTAEKLFALEAELLRLDTLKDVKRRIEQFEKMFARDALFKAEIVDKIDQTQQTLANEMAKAITKIKIKAIRNTDQAQINNVYNFLNNGVPFDSLFLISTKMDMKKICLNFPTVCLTMISRKNCIKRNPGNIPSHSFTTIYGTFFMLNQKEILLSLIQNRLRTSLQG